MSGISTEPDGLSIPAMIVLGAVTFLLALALYLLLTGVV